MLIKKKNQTSILFFISVACISFSLFITFTVTNIAAQNITPEKKESKERKERLGDDPRTSPPIITTPNIRPETSRNCGPFRASSNIRPSPECTDTRFFVDVDTGLDTGCTFRSGSPLVFTIKIDRYVGDLVKLKQNNLISPRVKLRIPVFDVDFSQGERDRVSINGNVLPRFLDGSNNTWHLNEFEIPLDQINLPASEGQIANNVIRIDIDTANQTDVWCTAVDWATIDIEVARPALLVHGILSGPGAWSPLWINEFSTLGLPVDAIDMGFLPDTIGNNSNKIAQKVEQLKQRWKVDKINLIAHSKGGLDSRDYAEFSDSVSQVIQIATPNAGSPLADFIIRGTIRLPPQAAILINVLGISQAPGGYQLTTPYMAGYNLLHGYNQKVKYTALAGLYDPDCIFCWEKGLELIVGRGDLIVPQSSVHSLGYTQNLTFNSVGLNDEATHTEINKSAAVFNRLKDAFGKPDSTTSNFNPSSFENNFQSSGTVAGPIPTASEVGTIQQSQQKTKTITVDQTSRVFFTLLYPSGDLNMALISPSGTRYDSSTIPNDPNVDLSDQEILGGRLEAITFNTLEAGSWTVEINAPSVVEPGGEVAYAVTSWAESSPITLNASFQNPNVKTGNPLKLLATVRNNSSPILGADTTATVQLPDDTKQSVVLSDDGTNGDDTANDGVYTANFTSTTQIGQYRVLFETSRNSVGNVPAFSREVLSAANVSQGNSSFTGIFSDSGSDTNSNTLFDNLVIQAGVNIADAGDYRVLGTLTDPVGNTHVAVKRMTFGAGQQNVLLEFDGERIYQNRVNGIFNLTSIRLLEETNNDLTLVDESNNSHQTGSYDFLDFEHLPIALTGNGSVIGVDTNANNLFDILRATIEIDVTRTGNYEWTGQLIDKNGGDLGFVTGSGFLNKGTNNIVLDYNGTNIGQNGIDGPYKVTGLLVFGQNFSLIEGDVLSSPSYLASQFEGFVRSGKARADFDGDGRTDLSVFRPEEGNWYINGSSNGFSVINWGIARDTLVPGDYDGDKKTDTATFRPTNESGISDFYILNSNGFTLSGYEWGIPGDIPVVADYDGDGSDDVAVFRPSNQVWYIINSGGGATYTSFGNSDDIPLARDFDGDGKADLTTYNNGTWITQNSGGGITRKSFGIAGDVLVPGDYDGDGKTDLAMFRPGNGNWYILKTTGMGETTVIHFGTFGDMPVPGDYDGDGAEDIAIYRGGIWYLNQSTSGISIISFGLVRDIPIP